MARQYLYISRTDREYQLQFPYHKDMIEAIKRVPVRRYIPRDHVWTIPMEWPRQLVFTVPNTPEWYVESFAAWAIARGFVSGVKRVADIVGDASVPDLPPMPELTVPHGLKIQPYPYQLQGIAYSLQHKRTFLADQPGLGKSMQAIGCISISGAFPCLVICPASLKINWQREWQKFAGRQAMILDDNNRGTWNRFYENGMCDVFITNYESLKKYFVDAVKADTRLTMKSITFNPLIELFRSVIIDESHRCRTGKTQQSKFCEGISRGKDYVLMLTGTPVVNDNTDLIAQLRIMGRLEDFGGYKVFADTFCQGARKSSNLKKLHYMLGTTCFFRREKQKVLKDLPDKMRQVMTCEITNRMEYAKAERDFIAYLREYKQADDEKIERARRGEIMVRMQLLRQISARGKVDAVKEFIADILEQREKLILFLWHNEILVALKHIFPSAVCVTGQENTFQKQQAIDSFQNNPETRLILCNYKSAGVGLTLTASSRVSFIEFPWTYADCEQSEDRAHRIGQKDSVNCYYFLGKNTIDEYIWQIIQAKKAISDGVTGTDDQVPTDVIDMIVNLFTQKIGGKTPEVAEDVFSGSTDTKPVKIEQSKTMLNLFES
jgi:SWI/SNF-related matrix-associated actin-dependent regulator 1 of chromatin subfamily A